MSGSRLLISIPDKSIGFAPGDEITINAHPLGLNGQKVTVRFLINDPLGATVHSIRAEERQVPDEGSSLAFSHTVDSDACSGSHLITAQLHSEAMNLREMATESFDVVIPGERLPDGFPAAQRDHLVESRHPFATATTGELAEAFETAHEACEPIRNDNGSWGVGEDGIPAAYRTPGNVTLGYLYGYEATGEKVYLDRATGGLDYLLAEQEPTGAYRWWRAGYPEGVLNDRDSFYDTGWAGLALAEGYRITQDERYLEGARRSGDWTLTCPFTGNNNYDAFALWYLSLLFEFTGEEKYLDTAEWRTEGGIFFAQLPRGGFPGHNFHSGYQSIIANGLASLYDVLPEGHPFEHRLRQRLCMALNFCTFLQSASGDFHQGWEYDRAFRLDEAGNPVGNTGVARAELIRAFHKSRNRLNLPQTIFNGLCQSTLGQIQTLMETPEAERRGGSLMGIGLLLNWATEDQTSG